MMKPSTADGYDNEVTRNCERVLVTLIRGLGPWRNSIFLVGGLTPRYLIERRPPDVPPHAGTGDVDVVIQLHMLADTDAYHTLEDNFQEDEVQPRHQQQRHAGLLAMGHRSRCGNERHYSASR